MSDLLLLADFMRVVNYLSLRNLMLIGGKRREFNSGGNYLKI